MLWSDANSPVEPKMARNGTVRAAHRQGGEQLRWLSVFQEEKVSASFFEKMQKSFSRLELAWTKGEANKLLLRTLFSPMSRDTNGQKFLLLFFKKEALPYFPS